MSISSTSGQPGVRLTKPPGWRRLLPLILVFGLWLPQLASNVMADSRPLRYGLAHEVKSLDPHGNITDVATVVLSELYTGLLARGADGRLLPGSAHHWRTSADQQSMTFELRPDLRWSDGEPLTAGDFAFAFQRLFRLNNQDAVQYFAIRGARELAVSGTLPANFGVIASGPRQLTIHLNHPEPALPELLAYVAASPVPRHQIRRHGADWSRPEHLVTNGPFRLRTHQGKTLVLEKNPHFYAAADVALTGIQFITPKANHSLGRMVIHGQLDVAHNFDFSQYRYIANHAPGIVRTHSNWSTYWYAINHRDPRLRDPAVRRALYLAVDREAIVNSFLNGLQPAYAMVPPNLLPPPTPPPIPHRSEALTEARRLIHSAGYSAANPLQLEITTRITPHDKIVAAIVARSWAQIHVRTKIITLSPLAQWQQLKSGNYSIGRLGWLERIHNPASFLTNFKTAAPFNNEAWSDSAYDALLEQSARQPDLTARYALLRQAQQRLLDKTVNIPLYHGVNQNLVNGNVTGWQENVYGVHPCRWLSLSAPQELREGK